MTRTDNRWEYWVKLILAAIFSLLVAFAGTITWVSYQQTMDYLHPAGQTASGEFLRPNAIEFQEVELITKDKVRLSAWYTPSKNGAIIRVAMDTEISVRRISMRSLPAMAMA